MLSIPLQILMLLMNPLPVSLIQVEAGGDRSPGEEKEKRKRQKKPEKFCTIRSCGTSMLTYDNCRLQLLSTLLLLLQVSRLLFLPPVIHQRAFVNNDAHLRFLSGQYNSKNRDDEMRCVCNNNFLAYFLGLFYKVSF